MNNIGNELVTGGFRMSLENKINKKMIPLEVSGYGYLRDIIALTVSMKSQLKDYIERG